MTHASLCSGIGTAELAATWLGWQNAFWCENDPFCRRVLKYRFKESTGYEDIRKTDFREWSGKIDVLTAGFPCQPFSTAGQRKGADDDRYLWPEIIRVIREVRPRWFIGENVAGITSMVQPVGEIEMGRQTDLFGENYRKICVRERYIIETVCQDLEQAGYTVRTVLIPACAVGAPHRRYRVFFIADTAGDGLQMAVSQNSKMLTEHIPNWRDFPTQSPVCRGNAGLPDGLAGITGPRWKRESIKAFGNTIVPQVIYEIFKAIYNP
jgi:DNA (cytosine-5)-methyltransferase 1